MDDAERQKALRARRKAEPKVYPSPALTFEESPTLTFEERILTTEERILWEKVIEIVNMSKWVSHGTGECLLYPVQHKGDYGIVKVLGGSHSAARVVLCACDDKPLDYPMHCSHRTPNLCKKGNRNCVNIAHLKWSSQEDNLLQRDRDADIRKFVDSLFKRA